MEPDIKRSILEKIERGEISMRPRIYFIGKVALIALLLSIIAALSIFALSFVFFSLHESGEQFLLGFGARGVLTFLGLFPWLTLALTVLLLFLVEALIRYFRFGYRTPLIRAFAVIFGATVAIGLLVNFTRVHMVLLDRADRGELPVIGELYETIHASHQDHGIYRGVITAISGNQFVISHDDADLDTDDGTWSVMPPSGFSTTSLKIGERVFVAGSLVATGTIQAYGIEPYMASR